MPAARCHRALQTDDVLACVLSKVEVRDACLHGLAAVCKQWRDAWCRRARGSYSLVGQPLGTYNYCDHLSATPGGGVIVPDYDGNCFHRYSREGLLIKTGCRGAIETPIAIALLDDDTAWAVSFDRVTVTRWSLDLEVMQDVHLVDYLVEINFRTIYNCNRVNDCALAGDALLVLGAVDGKYGQIFVLDSKTGDLRYRFGSTAPPGGVDELRFPLGLGAAGDYCFVADTYNQSIAIFNWRDGTFVRRYGKQADAPEINDVENWELDIHRQGYTDERRGTGPCEFIEPYSVAVRDRFLYVSERGGRRIQVIRLPDDLAGSEPEVVQIIDSPTGDKLSGICHDGARLWCMGPSFASSFAFLFAPIV